MFYQTIFLSDIEEGEHVGERMRQLGWMQGGGQFFIFANFRFFLELKLIFHKIFHNYLTKNPYLLHNLDTLTLTFRYLSSQLKLFSQIMNVFTLETKSLCVPKRSSKKVLFFSVYQ